MDLANFSPSDKQPNAHMGMRKESGYRVTLDLQHTITCLEKARIPVIAAVQGACVGGGVDLATATDMRYCTKDAFFLYSRDQYRNGSRCGYTSKDTKTDT